VATGADVLKEFVVAIGFKVDETSVRKFSQTFDKVVTGLAAVAASVAAAGLAIANHVNKVSSNFEKMYYTAQRVGTSVKSLQEVQYAAQQIGVSADEVTGQINNLYMTLKRNPGTAGILAGIGVNTQETDSVKLYMDFLDKMQHLPDSTKIQMGDIFGQDAQTMLQIMRNPAQFRAKVEERRRMTEAAGVDPDEQARKAVEYQNALRKLNEQLTIFGGIIAEKLLPYMLRLTTATISAVEWVSKLDPKILALVTTIGGFLVVLGALSTAIGVLTTVFGPLVGIFTSLAGVVGSIGAGGAAAAGTTAAVGAGGAAAAGGATAAIASIAAVVVPVVLGIVAALGIAYILKKTGVADAMQKWGEEHSVEKTWDKLKEWFGGKREEKREEAGGENTVLDKIGDFVDSTEKDVRSMWTWGKKIDDWTSKMNTFVMDKAKAADSWLADKTAPMREKASNYLSGVNKHANELGAKLLDKTASAAQQLIAGFEGWASKAYPDAGKMSIGFGHQIKPGEEGLLSRNISKEEGQQLLAQDVGKHEAAVRQLTQGLGLNDKMIAALTSLHYNMGKMGETMTQKLQSGDFAGAAKAFELYNKSEGKINQGLVTRRAQEQAQFLEGLRDMQSGQGQGNGGSQFHQETNININGAGDPQRVATAVADEQSRVNQSAMRNLQPRTA
jgi:GH24 family phage-related lysozyme (muramidase)